MAGRFVRPQRGHRRQALLISKDRQAVRQFQEETADLKGRLWATDEVRKAAEARLRERERERTQGPPVQLPSRARRSTRPSCGSQSLELLVINQ